MELVQLEKARRSLARYFMPLPQSFNHAMTYIGANTRAPRAIETPTPTDASMVQTFVTDAQSLSVVVCGDSVVIPI